jgi:hypothetical protein
MATRAFVEQIRKHMGAFMQEGRISVLLAAVIQQPGVEQNPPIDGVGGAGQCPGAAADHDRAIEHFTKCRALVGGACKPPRQAPTLGDFTHRTDLAVPLYACVNGRLKGCINGQWK